MRSELEMISLIVNTAKEDDRIKAVYMNGSRTNLNVPKDKYQDYDIVYVVNETKSFRNDKKWIHRFGEILYMQYPEDNSYYENDVENCYGWLMQFTDGNRLDLHVTTLPLVLKEIKEDKLCKILLDKNGCLPNIPEASDETFWVKKPKPKQYEDTCNEFWWLLNNIAKGQWREEIPYTMDMLNFHTRPQLTRMLSWKIGYETDFSISVGKSAKYMYKWLDKDVWDKYLSTYPAGNVESIWNAVFDMCELFETTARDVADRLGVVYNEKLSMRSLGYLRGVKENN